MKPWAPRRSQSTPPTIRPPGLPFPRDLPGSRIGRERAREVKQLPDLRSPALAGLIDHTLPDRGSRTTGAGSAAGGAGRRADRLACFSAYFFTAEEWQSLRTLTARMRTTRLAAILIGSPVCGLRPMRAFRFERNDTCRCPE
jgi:hypothetical protein